jgi:hypothetical protein
MHNSAFWPAAHGQDIEHCLLYIREIEENELEKIGQVIGL